MLEKVNVALQAMGNLRGLTMLLIFVSPPHIAIDLREDIVEMEVCRRTTEDLA